MDLSSGERVVKTGTFNYGGLPLCKVRIVQTDSRPGSGDAEDSEGWRQDQGGTFFRIDYTPARSDHFVTGAGYCSSRQEAMRAVERSVDGVVWVT